MPPHSLLLIWVCMYSRNGTAALCRLPVGFEAAAGSNYSLSYRMRLGLRPL